MINRYVYLKKCLLLSFVCLTGMLATQSQTIPREELIFLTAAWKGERFPDGRPKVPDALVERARKIVQEALTEERVNP